MNSGQPAAGALQAGSLVAGKFLLDRPLGQGGMGAVWLAQHTALRIPCALKFLHAGAAESPDVRARFEREAVAAAQLRSPHVVQILDHGVWAGAPYIAMELLDGEDLLGRLRRVRRLSLRDTAAIVAQVARALTRAHAAGLVHRDLKPANIFLVRDDDRELAKVLDFGIAKFDSGVAVDSQTKTGSLLGTPFYMSPEQAQGAKNLDHRSDLWALAVVTYQCLIGRLPFSADAMGALFMAIIVHPLPVPSQLGPEPPLTVGGTPIPLAFDDWWLRAASRDPAARFQSAKELSEALNVALGVTEGELVLRATGPAPPPLVLSLPLASAALGPAVGAPPYAVHAGQEGLLATPGGVMSASASPSSVSVAAAPTRRGSSVAVLAAAVVACGLLAAGALLLNRTLREAAGVGAAAPASATAPSNPVPPSPAVAALPPATSTGSSSAAPSAEAKTPSAASAAPSMPAKATPVRRAAPSCSPPYTVDDNGFKHAKPECI